MAAKESTPEERREAQRILLNAAHVALPGEIDKPLDKLGVRAQAKLFALLRRAAVFGLPSRKKWLAARKAVEAAQMVLVLRGEGVSVHAVLTLIHDETSELAFGEVLPHGLNVVMAIHPALSDGGFFYTPHNPDKKEIARQVRARRAMHCPNPVPEEKAIASEVKAARVKLQPRPAGK